MESNTKKGKKNPLSIQHLIGTRIRISCPSRVENQSTIKHKESV